MRCWKWSLPSFLFLVWLAWLLTSSYAASAGLTHTTAADFIQGDGDAGFNLTQHQDGELALAQTALGLTPWTELVSTSLPQTLYEHALVATNGHLFVLGGQSSNGAEATVYRAAILADGGLGPWQAMPALPQPLLRHAALKVGGGLLVIGGARGGAPQERLASIYRSAVMANGDLDAWVELTATPLPRALVDAGAAVVNGYLFIVGGEDSSGQLQPTLYRAVLNADGSLGAWTMTTSLPISLTNHAIATAGNCLFVVGGDSNLGRRSQVYSAAVAADGIITTWQELANARLPQPLARHTATMIADQLVVVGGLVQGSAGDQDEVYRAVVKADCTLEPWQALTEATLPQRSIEHATAALDGHLFVTGGHRLGNVAQYNTVYQASIIPDQELGGWQELSQTPLPQPLSALSAAFSEDYLFVTGGISLNDTVQSTVYRATALTEGQIGPWTAVSSLPQPLHDHVTLAVEGRLLTLGGHNGSADQNTVYEAGVKADGSLSAWQPHPCSLPVDLSSHTAVLANDYIYLSGGRQGFSERSEVYRLKRADDGSPGCWQPVTPLPQPLAEHAMAGDNGHLFVTGGVTGGGGYISRSVYSATIKADGALSAWTELSASSLPIPLRSHSMVVDHGFLYVIGGFQTITGLSTQYQVYRAKIRPDGGLEAWQELVGRPLPQALEKHVALVTDLYLLVLGGYRSNQPRATAYVTSLYRAVPQAAFSHRFDLGSVQDLGVLRWRARGYPGADLNVRFRIAGDDAQYGPWSEAFTEPPVPIYERGRYLQYQFLVNNPMSGVKAIDEVGLTYGDVGDYVTVVDHNRVGLPNAEVYLNGQRIGTTGVRGVLPAEALPAGLRPGDQLAVLSQVTQTGTKREAHVTLDSERVNWAYRTYLTNLEITPPAGQVVPYTVSQPGGQVISLQPDNALVLFNLLVSIEWDADVAYTEQISRAVRSASAYLYDLTDGQMAFGRVTIYDNAEYWSEADLQISTKNMVRPHAYIGGITSDDKSHVIRVGRFWDGKSGNQGSWDQSDGYRTLAHEFGHYALDLYDEYFIYVFGPNGNLLREDPASCTSPNIPVYPSPEPDPATDPTNASAMYYHYNASELSARDVPGLWSSLCEQTAQWQLNGESTWETLVRRYADFLSPARWQFVTPINRGSLVVGPNGLPDVLPDWPVVEIYQDGSSAPVRQLTVYGPQGPYWGAQVALYTNQGGYPVAIDQGFTDQLGQLDIYGAQPGDTLRAASFDGALSGSVSVTNATDHTLTMNAPASLQVLAVPGLNAHLTLRPGSDGNTLYLRLAGLGPGGTLVATATQSGGTASQTTALSYSNTEEAYIGAVAFSAPQARRGTGSVQVVGAGVGSQGISLNSTYALQAAPRAGVTDLFSADGNLHLHLITDTLPVDAFAVLAPLNAAPIQPPEGLQIVGNVFDIKLSGVLEEAEQPFVLKLHYDLEVLEGEFIGPETLRIYRWEPDPDPADPTDQAHWLALNSTWLAEDNSVSTATSRFGVYALMGFNTARSIYLPIIMKSKQS